MTQLKEYNGHRSWNAWNVSLWINGDEFNYRLAKSLLKEYSINEAASIWVQINPEGTPDGGVYNKLTVKLAMEDMQEAHQ